MCFFESTIAIAGTMAVLTAFLPHLDTAGVTFSTAVSRHTRKARPQAGDSASPKRKAPTTLPPRGGIVSIKRRGHCILCQLPLLFAFAGKKLLLPSLMKKAVIILDCTHFHSLLYNHINFARLGNEIGGSTAHIIKGCL